MKSKIIIENLNNSKCTNNYSNKDNNCFLENEISIILKKIRKELNAHIKIYKNHKVDFLQATNEFKIENNKFKILNSKISILEKEAELISKKIAKIKKKKIYSINSVIRFKNLYKQTNLENYKSILNVGINGPKDNFYFFNILKEKDDEFNYYLKFLEKYYTDLKKENKKKFDEIKNNVYNLINGEKLSFPEDKLFYYLRNCFQIIDFNEDLQEKLEQLKNENLMKNEINIKMKNLQTLMNEKNNVVQKSNDFIEFLKDLIKKFINYQKKSKNNLIPKDILYKKIRKLQSIFLSNFSKEKSNNFPKHEISKSDIHENDRYSKFIPDKNKKRKLKAFNLLPNKYKNVLTNISTDYLPKVEGPLTKKNNLEKNENFLNDIFFTLTIDKSEITEKENISENTDNESPISTINITSRKKNLTNDEKSNKTTIQNNIKFDKILIPEFSINGLNYLNNSEKAKKNQDSQILYHKKIPNINRNKKKRRFESQIKIETNHLENFSKEHNNFLNENKTIEIPIEKNIQDNFKKNSYFIKKASKNKRFFINKEKLFNQNRSQTINLNKKYLNNYGKEQISAYEKRLSKQILKNNKNNCYIPYNKNGKNKIAKNNIIIQKINNFYGPIYPKNYDDTIQSYKEEIKEDNYLYLNKKKIRRNYYSFITSENKQNFTPENCCISCT